MICELNRFCRCDLRDHVGGEFRSKWPRLLEWVNSFFGQTWIHSLFFSSGSRWDLDLGDCCAAGEYYEAGQAD
jgi:hypothetical protein